MSKIVEFLGERNDVPHLLGLADLFVMSSLHEGISLALLEALSMKVPVLATDVGGTREIIRNGVTGIVVPSGRSDLMGEEITKLMVDEGKRKKLSEAGYDMVVRNFSIERMVHMYEKIYAKIGLIS